MDLALLQLPEDRRIIFNSYLEPGPTRPYEGYFGVYVGQLLEKGGKKEVSKRIRKPNGKQETVFGWAVLFEDAKKKAGRNKVARDEAVQTVIREFEQKILRWIEDKILVPMNQLLKGTSKDIIPNYHFVLGNFGGEEFGDGVIAGFTPLPLPCNLPDLEFSYKKEEYVLRWFAENASYES